MFQPRSKLPVRIRADVQANEVDDVVIECQCGSCEIGEQVRSSLKVGKSFGCAFHIQEKLLFSRRLSVLCRGQTLSCFFRFPQSKFQEPELESVQP
jgi:hypothetical protein